MKRLVIVSLSVLLSVAVQAQNLLIRYDFLKDDYTFYKVVPGKQPKQIDKPVVGRNNTVKLEVVNFNKFVYAGECSFTSGASDEGSTINFMNFLTPLVIPQSGASFLTQFGGADDNTQSARGVKSFGDRLADQSYNTTLSSYNSLYEVQSTVRNIDFSILKLQELKYNRYLPADTIKKIASTLVTSAIKSPTANHQDFLNTIQNLNQAYQANLSSFKLSAGDFEGSASRLSSIGANDKAQLKRLSEEVENMDAFYNDDFIATKVNLMENMYESIINTQFQFNASDLADQDFMDIALDVYEYPTDDNGLPKTVSLTDISDLTKVKNKKLKITVKGDLKINSSLGLAFPYYSGNNNYINVNSSIVEQTGNNFAPNVAAFMNFYPYNGRLAQWGGTFGLGYPLGSSSGNLNVFMGGSSLFGSNNRIVINAGASLGQVQQLDMGLKTGDALENDYVDVPVRDVWKWGAFVGISFSIANVKN